MIILGLQPVTHDVSAALVIDGVVVAAADEERFTRRKHGFGQLPVQSAAFCLRQAGIEPKDVEVVAFPWSDQAMREQRWRYLSYAFGRRPGKAFRQLFTMRKKQRKREDKLRNTLRQLGIDPERVEIVPVEHHIAHAASAFHCSGFERAAIASLDGVGELATTLFARGDGRRIEKIFEVYKPDSLGHFYSTMTQYLGFQPLNGEYKLMGMAPYGDAETVSLDRLLPFGKGRYQLDQRYLKAGPDQDKGILYSSELERWLGPARKETTLKPEDTAIAAATQELFERVTLHLIETHLGDVLKETGKLCLAGGCALNVVLNRKLTEHPLVQELYVQPNAGDGGTSLGAALQVAVERGEPRLPLRNVYLGPEYDHEACLAALQKLRIPYEEPKDLPKLAAQLIAAGEPVAWFQGRMEWGPRALGNRSILGHPGLKGQTQDINRRVKFRETWRPFCPSVLAEHGPELFDNPHDAPYMTITFGVREEWRGRLTEITHVDGSARPQYVREQDNPRYRKLIEHFYELTGLPCVINTSLNRRGEPIVCTPEDVLRMFFGSGVEFLVMGDFLVRKRPLPEGIEA